MSRPCYYPDGSLSHGGFPCANKDTGHTTCCGLNQFCTSNGLCIARDLTIFRGSCTDKTWTSIDCPRTCIKQFNSALAPVLPCGDGRFSCTSDCSDNANVVTLAAAQITLLAPVSTSLPAGSNLATNLVTTTSGSSVESKVSCSRDVGEIAGVGVGIGVPLLLAFLGAMLLYLRERQRNRKVNIQEAVEVPNNERFVMSNTSTFNNFTTNKPSPTSGSPDAELSSVNNFRELEGTLPPVQSKDYI